MYILVCIVVGEVLLKEGGIILQNGMVLIASASVRLNTAGSVSLLYMYSTAGHTAFSGQLLTRHQTVSSLCVTQNDHTLRSHIPLYCFWPAW